MEASTDQHDLIIARNTYFRIARMKREIFPSSFHKKQVATSLDPHHRILKSTGSKEIGRRTGRHNHSFGIDELRNAKWRIASPERATRGACDAF